MKTFLLSFSLFVSLIYILLINVYWHSIESPFANKSQALRIQRIDWAYNPYDISSLSPDDFTTLVNISNFRYIINSKRCEIESHNNSDLFLVVFVHSAPNNFDKRLAIRKTWGNENNLINNKMRIVFLVGQVNESSVQRNKHIMGLKWVVYFCQNAKYVFKTDDDIFVDIFQLIFYLKGTFGNNYPPKNLISCYVIYNPYPKRSQRSKWRVTFQEYRDKYYPPYCAGWGILMSPDVVFKLYLSSRQFPYFWVDDVHISGVLARHVGLNHIDFSPKLAIGDNDIDLWLKSDQLSVPPLFGHPDSDLQTIYALWNKTVKYYTVKYRFLNLN
jgi:hypothetical protein